MNEICKGYKNCPIYSGILKSMEMTSKAYRARYCEGGKEGWESCKRYQVKQLTGECPSDLLPNTTKSIEQIIRHYNLKML